MEKKQEIKEGIKKNSTRKHGKHGKHGKHLRVPVLPEEEQEIKENAAKAGLGTAEYLRRLGLGFKVQNIIDKQYVIELAKINADLGRLGGLLKLWLSNDERLVQIEAKTILTVLERIRNTQEAMFEVVKKLCNSF